MPTVARFIEQLAPSSVTRARRRRALAAVAVVGLLAAAVGVRYYGGAIEGRVLDDRSRMQRNVPELPDERPVLTAEQEQRIASWLQLAELNLGDITPESSADDIAYILSDSPNSVRQLYESVLRVDPWYEEGLRLRDRVVQLYSTKAQQLVDSEDYENAEKLVRRGIDIDPSSRTLYRLQDTVCDNEPELCRPR